MKKMMKKIAVVMTAALLGAFVTGCSMSDENPFNPNAPYGNTNNGGDNGGGSSGGLAAPVTYSTKASIQFDITTASSSAADTKIFVQYDRSAKAAKECVKITDAEINLYVNGEKAKTYNSVTFELDAYGSSFDGQTGEIKDSDNRKQYKVKLDTGKQLAAGDVVKVEWVKGTVTPVDSTVNIARDKFEWAIIDVAESVDYYKELADTDTLFKPLTEESASTPAAATTKTYTNCPSITVTTTKAVAAGDFAFVLQIDNDGTKDADGLKIDVTDFEMSVKVGNETPFTYTNSKIEMIPNAYASPAYGKTDCRFVLDGSKAIASGTEITIQVKKATVSNKDKADSIIYVFNENGVSGYAQYVADADNYKSPFTGN